MHGRSKVESDGIGLSNTRPGEGLRLCEDSAGRIMRYKGQNGIAIIGGPRTGKNTSLVAAMIVEPALPECTSRGVRAPSKVIVDPKGELLAETIETLRRLGPVKVFCPSFDGLPKAVIDRLGETDSYNMLDLCEDPQSPAFVSQCDAAGDVFLKGNDGEMQDGGFFTRNAKRAIFGVIQHLKGAAPCRSKHGAGLPEILSTEEIFPFAREAMKTGTKYVQMTSLPVRGRRGRKVEVYRRVLEGCPGNASASWQRRKWNASCARPVNRGASST